jgi:hypothetical protein
MLMKKVFTATAVSLATLLSVGAASAEGFNEKEINGRTSYIGAAFANSDVGKNQFSASTVDETIGTRDGKKVTFDDGDGFLGTIGNDYGYVRLETEFGYRKTEVASVTNLKSGAFINSGGDVHIGTAMINLALEYSFDLGETGVGKDLGNISVTPYITAGGGMMGVIGDLNYQGSASRTGAVDRVLNEGVDNAMGVFPTVQGGAGLTLGLPYGLEIFGGYSESLAYTYETRGSSNIHLQTVSGGMRINF